MNRLTTIKFSELQLRLGSHDQNALKQLYDEYSNRLFHFAYGLIHSKELAEEIVQDVFIKIWEKRERISTLENLTGYLYTVTKNLSCSYLRKYNGSRHINIDEFTLPYFKIDVSPEELMITNEMLQKINQAINDLPPRCRVIFKLVKEDGLKYKEVAGLLDISLKTVENQVGLALKKLHCSIDTFTLKPIAKY